MTKEPFSELLEVLKDSEKPTDQEIKAQCQLTDTRGSHPFFESCPLQSLSTNTGLDCLQLGCQITVATVIQAGEVESAHVHMQHQDIPP